MIRIWKDGDRNFERSLKNKKKASQFCPICNLKLLNEKEEIEKEVQKAFE